MEHYCSKCLVNKVEHEGDICAACGGTKVADTRPGVRRPAAQDSSPAQGTVNISSRRRLMGTPPFQSGTSVDSSSHVEIAQSGGSASDDKVTVSASSKKKGSDSRSGVIQNFSAGEDERSFLERILDSIFLGISYNGGNNLFMTEFQLYENWNSGYSASSATPQATRVVYYGKVGQGRPVENNDVTVYGVYNHKTGYFIAERIMNQTDGTYANFVPQKISAAVIRVLAVLLLLVILYGAFTLFTGGSGGARAGSFGVGGGLQQILLGLITTAFGVGAIMWARVSRQFRFRFPIMAVGTLLVFVGLFIMTARDLEGNLSLLKSEIINIVVMVIILRIVISMFLGAISRPNPTVDKILNWVTVIVIVLTISSAAVKIFLA